MRVIRISKGPLLALLALVAAANPASARERQWKPTPEDRFYAACYIFTSGENVATAFPPFKTNGDEMYNYFEGNLGRAVLPLFPQHHSIRCVTGDTPEEAARNRVEHGYSLQEAPWPKGLPDAARPLYIQGKGTVPRGSIANEVFYVACSYFQPGQTLPPSTWFPVVRATGAEFSDDLRGKVERIVRLRDPNAMVNCTATETEEEVTEWRSRFFPKVAEAPWPAEIRLASLGRNAPPAPPKKPAAPKGPAKPIVIPALTIKEDTGPRDAAERWEATVKKTLAAEARVKAETAAKALQQDAEMKRKIAEFMAERRRQGARQ